MTDSVLQKYSKMIEPNLASQFDPDPEASDDYGAFGWLRGQRERAIMLELRKKDGRILALAYSWLQQLEYDPSTGILLSFPGVRIKLTGRYLNHPLRPGIKLFEGLTRQRINFIQEADEVTLMQTTGEMTVIERLEW